MYNIKYLLIELVIPNQSLIYLCTSKLLNERLTQFLNTKSPIAVNSHKLFCSRKAGSY